MGVRVNRVRSILVITKHNFMGDTIVATPLLRAIRQIYPEAVITLLTGGGAAVLTSALSRTGLSVRRLSRCSAGRGCARVLIPKGAAFC